MSTIEAVYENCVFRPLGPVALPEHARVVFEPRLLDEQQVVEGQDAVHEVLSRRYRSGHHDTAERHNDPSPSLEEVRSALSNIKGCLADAVSEQRGDY